MTSTTSATIGSRASAVGDPARESVRLGDADATYWFLHRALGWSVVLQLVWTFDGPVSREALAEMNRGLTHGRLHRRLIASRVPAARPRWVDATGCPELRYDDEVIDDDSIDAWAADDMATVALDPESGRCWRLRAVRSGSGKTAVSLCALHLVVDGRTLVQAAAAAMGPLPAQPANPVRQPAGEGMRRWRTGHRGLMADLVDAGGQVFATGRGAVRAVRSVTSRDLAAVDAAPARPLRAPMAERAPRAEWVRATAAVPSDVWDRVASAAEGTSNSLFVGVVAGLLRSSGYAPLGETIKVGIPVDQRSGDDDPRANATAGVAVMMTDDPTPGGDLAMIRRACKDAYARLTAGRRPAVAHLQPMVWMVPPAWLITAATAGTGMPDAMVSNIGDVPSQALRLDGFDAQRFAFRGMAQGVDPALPYRFGDGVQSWCVRTEETITLSVFGCDETAFRSDEHIRELLGAELSAWGLPYEYW
ncbi:hypothetical protein [Gordonia insulae]|uniref:Diacylglycerol O-acyltransferase n=1 Tax=Gordonia insulae TaxID=2420509 RepID=A0A3G8JJQ1_9ACTN|nr:hypothetical protein [Gordonia insulae]AZG45233.1 hypothetical protein D7316_01828 [Gordonia insulae]